MRQRCLYESIRYAYRRKLVRSSFIALVIVASEVRRVCSGAVPVSRLQTEGSVTTWR